MNSPYQRIKCTVVNCVKRDFIIILIVIVCGINTIKTWYFHQKHNQCLQQMSQKNELPRSIFFDEDSFVSMNSFGKTLIELRPRCGIYFQCQFLSLSLFREKFLSKQKKRESCLIAFRPARYSVCSVSALQMFTSRLVFGIQIGFFQQHI